MLVSTKNKIKKDYLQNTKPDALAKKYNIPINQVYNLIRNNNWTNKKKEIDQKFNEQIEEKLAAELETGTKLAVNTLIEIMMTSEKNTEKINAARAFLDISGLKKSDVKVKNESIDKENIDRIAKELGLDFN